MQRLEGMRGESYDDGRYYSTDVKRTRNSGSADLKPDPDVDLDEFDSSSPSNKVESDIDTLSSAMGHMDLDTNDTVIRHVGDSSGITSMLILKFGPNGGTYSAGPFLKIRQLDDDKRDFVMVSSRSEDKMNMWKLSYKDELAPEPHPDMRDRLVDIFFERIHPSCAFIHKGQFLSYYKANEFDKISQSLLYAVMGCAAALWPTDELRANVEEPVTSGSDLRRRSMMSCWKEMACPTIGTVQAMALLLHVQGGELAEHVHDDGYLWTGMMVRAAHDLGLHIDSSKWKIPAAEKEARHRTWWACYVCDRWCSTGFGRPLSINDNDHDTPKPQPNFDFGDANSTLDDASTQSQSNIPTMCFIELIRLSEILGHVLTSLYSVKARKQPAYSLVNIVRLLDMELQQWRKDLPKDFVLYDDDPDPAVAAAQPANPYAGLARILMMSFHTVMILIHRPFVPRYGRNHLVSSHDVLTSDLPSHSRCTESGERIVNLAVKTTLEDYRNFSWSFTHFMIYTGALINISNIITATRENAQQALTAKRNLRKLLVVVDDFSGKWKGATALCGAIRLFLQIYNVKLDGVDIESWTAVDDLGLRSAPRRSSSSASPSDTSGSPISHSGKGMRSGPTATPVPSVLGSQPYSSSTSLTTPGTAQPLTSSLPSGSAVPVPVTDAAAFETWMPVSGGPWAGGDGAGDGSQRPANWDMAEWMRQFGGPGQ